MPSLRRLVMAALFAAIHTTILATAVVSAADTCTTGALVSDNISKHYDPVRISPGLVCSPEQATGANASCPLQSWAYLSYGNRFNVTFSSDEQKEALIDALPDQGGVTPFVKWRWVIHGIVMNETFQVPEGRAAYVQFEEAYDCATTKLSGCDGNLAELEGQYIESCIPMYNTGSGSIPMFYDESSLVFVNAETAREMTDHPFARNETGSNETIVGGGRGGNGTEEMPTLEQQEENQAGVVGASGLALVILGLAAVLGSL